MAQAMAGSLSTIKMDFKNVSNKAVMIVTDTGKRPNGEPTCTWRTIRPNQKVSVTTPDAIRGASQNKALQPVIKEKVEEVVEPVKEEPVEEIPKEVPKLKLKARPKFNKQ